MGFSLNTAPTRVGVGAGCAGPGGGPAVTVSQTKKIPYSSVTSAGPKLVGEVQADGILTTTAHTTMPAWFRVASQDAL